MSKELKEVFRTALPETPPPTSLDVDAMEADGVRATRRRRIFVGGGVTVAAVAAIAALVVTLPGGFVQGDSESTENQAAAASDQPEFPLPELDPDKDDYSWLIESTKQTSDAEEYATAFRNWFDDRGLPLESPWDELDPHMAVETQTLVDGSYMGPESKSDVPDYTRPVYNLVDGGEDVADGDVVDLEDTDYLVAQFPDRPVTDILYLEVYANGSYLPGDGESIAHLVTCRDYEEKPKGSEEKPSNTTISHDYTCTEVDGPDGERIIQVQHTMVVDEGGSERPFTYKENIVAYYRTDGTAVLVTDNIPGSSDDAPTAPDISDVEPNLSLEDLTDLAASMPNATVDLP